MLEKALEREYMRLANLRDYFFLETLKALSVENMSEYEACKMAYLKVKAQMDALEEALGYV